MSPKDRVRSYIIDRLRGELQRLRIPERELIDKFSLIESGAVDSLRFIELLSAVENEFSITINLEGIDPQDFTTLGGLTNMAARELE